MKYFTPAMVVCGVLLLFHPVFAGEKPKVIIDMVPTSTSKSFTSLTPAAKPGTEATSAATSTVSGSRELGLKELEQIERAEMRQSNQVSHDTIDLTKDDIMLHPTYRLSEEGKGVQEDVEETLRNLILSQTKPAADNVLVAFLIWNEGVPAPVDDALWKVSTHPKVGGTLKIIMSSLHRARNHGIQHLFTSTHKGLFSHILFVHQDVVFERDAVDKLLDADVPIISALSVRRFAPFDPYFIPLDGNTEDWTWLEHKIFDEKYEGPLRVKATGFEMALVSIEALKKAVNVYGNKLEWFWLSGADGYLKDEEMTFCYGCEAKGIDVYVHLGVRIRRVQPVEIGYDFLWNSQATERSRDMREQLAVVSPSGRAVVAENKIQLLRTHNITFNVLNERRMANVVVLNAVWATYNPATHGCVWNLAQHPDIIGRISITHSEVVEARNDLLRSALDNFPELTHVLFVDADMTFTVEDYVKLRRADKGIIFGLAVKRLIAEHPPAYMPLSGHPKDHSLLFEALASEPLQPIEVKGGGMAFTLIKREVLDVTYRERSDGLKEWFWCQHYVDTDSQMKHHLSEDYSFGQRARENGYPVYMHTGVQIGHVDDETVTVKNFLESEKLEFKKGALTV